MMPRFNVSRFPAVIAALLMLLAAAARAEQGQFVPDPDAQKYALILVGAAVNDEKASEFGRWALDLRHSLQEDYGYQAGKLRLLMGDATQDDFNVDGSSRAETIRESVSALAEQIKSGDQLNVFLIGHGAGRGEQAKFAIVGPDLSGPQFAELLAPIKSSNIVIVNTTSASHDFAAALSANGRVVVSATRSPAERYDTVFPRFFVEGLKGQAADRDKNSRVSVLEAFSFANARVAEYFRERDILPSEHAALDDNGDGVFSVNPDRRGDGQLAEIAYLDVSSVQAGNLSAEASALRNRMSKLERDIFLLRANKSTQDTGEYWAQMEPLLIELAKATRDFNALSP